MSNMLICFKYIAIAVKHVMLCLDTILQQFGEGILVDFIGMSIA